MGAFELAREVNGEGEVANGVLAFVGAVEDLDGELDAADADPVDCDVAGIGGFLNIGQVGGGVVVLIHGYSRRVYR